MDKILSLVLSKGGLRWGAGGVFAASGVALMSGYVAPDAGGEAQLMGAAALVGGIVLALAGPKVAALVAGKFGKSEEPKA